VVYDPPDEPVEPPRACRDYSVRKRWPNRSDWVPLIGEAHGWACHVCGDLIDRKLASTHWLGPTILLVVPTAIGGSATSPLNMRVAHRACNDPRDAELRAAA
jgi:hypothetical protein